MITLMLLGCVSDGFFRIDGGEYQVVFPDNSSNVSAALLMLHGHQGAPAAFVESAETVSAITQRNVLLVAPAGEGGNWSAPHSPQEDGRDDLAFLDDVLADVQQRWAPPVVWIGGSSQGAAMAESHTALRGGQVQGVVALSGGFWSPVPKTCPSQVPPITHSHGTQDTTWPLDGRTLYGAYTQAPIAEDIAFWRTCAQCSDESTEQVDGPLTCTVWSTCERGGPVRFCVHDGGHGRQSGWAERQLDWLMSLGG